MNNSTAVKNINIILKSILSLAVISGIIALMLSNAPNNGFNMLSFYTIQTNLIVLFVALYGIMIQLKGKQENNFFHIIKNGSVLWIFITGTGYHFLLSNMIHAHGYLQYSLISLHYITPVLALIIWFFFEEKGKCEYIYSLYWLVYPALYLIATEIRSLFDKFIPYWFLQPAKKFPEGVGSYANLAVVIVILGAVFIILGLGFVKLDRIMKDRLNFSGTR